MKRILNERCSDERRIKQILDERYSDERTQARFTTGPTNVQGFTLVELLVAMLCAAVIMVAAMTWLLVGIRVETSAAEGMERQQTARIVLTMLESMTTSGKVARVQELDSETMSGSGKDWALLDDSGKVLVRYRAGSGTIVSGSGDILMADLEFASAKIDESSSLLQLSLTSDGQKYESDIYCRTQVEPMSYGSVELLEAARQGERTTSNRMAFLSLLSSQLGSDGTIKDPTNAYKYDYFTQCYLNMTGNRDLWSLEGSGTGMNWSPKTPWCATYVSWAMLHMNHYCVGDDQIVLAYVPMFANVNDGRALFDENYVLGSGFGENVEVGGNVDCEAVGIGNGKLLLGKDRPEQKAGKWISSLTALSDPDVITPGDLIFFDWGDGVNAETGAESGNENGAGSGLGGGFGDGSGAGADSGNGEESLDHVGVVFHIDESNGQVFTIEGNTDGTVALRSYSLTDPSIKGFGLLDWAVSPAH